MRTYIVHCSNKECKSSLNILIKDINRGLSMDTIKQAADRTRWKINGLNILCTKCK